MKECEPKKAKIIKCLEENSENLHFPEESKDSLGYKRH